MIQNPFVISGYAGPDYFCDRKDETSRLINAIENGRHSTIIAPRRIGKTGLIFHAFGRLNRKEYVPVYIDILPTTSLTEFASIFIKSLLKAILLKQRSIKKIAQQLSSLRLNLSIDPISGEPSVILTHSNPEEAEKSIEKVISYIKSSDYHFVIAIDEFQQISVYSEKTTEAFLRSQIQNITNLTMIFSGSRRHLLTEMFTSPQRPLFGTTEILELNKIDRESYFTFIMKMFNRHKKKISDEAIIALLEETNNHTYYVQYLCNRLFSTDGSDEEDLYNMISIICNENVSVYANYLNLLTNNQSKLLRSICLNRGVQAPTSKEFIAKYNLGAASTVNQSLHSLIVKEFVYKEDEVYQAFDPFMATWLRSIF
ncbi:MAG: ATP-binding protein [Bacteroidales bacterium]|nr:ATP-binding protein [Bacteroidales bacterium]